MATSKKTQVNNKKFTQKVHKVVQSDIFKSLAVTSVLLNVLFLVTVLVLTSTDTFDRKLYTSAREKYCNNINAIADRAEELGSEDLALKEYQVDCIGKGFSPFYNEAIEKFKAQTGE